MGKMRSLLLSCVLLLAGVFLISCLPTTGHISWQASDEVELELGKGQLPSGYSYYYLGPEAIPHTIIGIPADVPFQPNFWKPAEFGKQQVNEWLEAIDNKHRDVKDFYFGGRLLDRKGNFLGIWYSKYHFYSGYVDSEGRLVIMRPLRRQQEFRTQPGQK